MESTTSPAEEKFSAIVMNAPVGVLEIDAAGLINYMNTKAGSMLDPIRSQDNSHSGNFYEILGHIAPGTSEKIRAYQPSAGLIFNEVHKFSLRRENDGAHTWFKIMANKMDNNCVIVALEDVSLSCEQELVTRHAIADKAVAQGKFEIAAEVLHDIGNAVVGFGSYLTRIRRTVEQDSATNLKNLSAFFESHQPVIGSAIGEAKAAAVVTMFHSLIESQQTNHEEIQKSLGEQLHIITHIQEILNIHRQYVSGQCSQERISANLRSIIGDCLSMLFAAIEKRGITVNLDCKISSPVVQGDRTRLMQVIMNILKNSIEAIDIQATEKMISILLQEEDEQLTLLIKDNGSGFDGTTAGHLFGRGFTTKSSGTGLGLHNCRTILESHSGSISLTSDGPGLGATTRIKFKI